MSVKNPLPWAGFAALGGVGMILYGCSAPEVASGTEGSRTPPAYLASDASPAPVTQVIDVRPVALADGRAIEWSELKPALAELAGAEALQEIILDRLLDRELSQRGMVISESDIDAERARLVDSLHADPNVAARLLDELRESRRLGPWRYRALLRRNAALRALVRDQVRLTEPLLDATFDQLHGERRQVRMLTAPNLQTAQEARQRVAGGEPFADVAVDVSTDISAARGGLLEPICRSDARYPDALRQSAFALAPGELSAPVLIGSQYAVIQLVRITEPTAWFIEEHRDEVTRVARLTQERLHMERLARDLLGRVAITFFDDSIRQRYRALMREGTGPIDTAASSPR